MQIPLLIGAAAALLMLQSWIYAKFGLRNMVYERYFSEKAVYAGETVEMVERIANRKWLPMTWIRMESVMKAGIVFASADHNDISAGELMQNHRSLFSLMPYKQVRRRHQVLCAKRGWYRCNTVTMTTGDLLGMSRRSRTWNIDADIVVYPELLPYDQLNLPSHHWQGDAVVRRWILEDPFLVSGVRDYEPGDSLRAVNWKATARTGNMQVNKHDYTADRRFMLMLNLDVSPQMWNAVTDAGPIEEALRYAATMAQLVIEQGLEAGFASNGQTEDRRKEPIRVPLGGGHDHLGWLLEAMAKLELVRSVPFDALLEEEQAQQTERIDYVLFTAYVDDKIEAQIDRLRRQGNAVEIIALRGGAS